VKFSQDELNDTPAPEDAAPANEAAEAAADAGSQSAAGPGDAAAAGREAATPQAPPTEAALREQLARLQAERDDLFRTLQRLQADFDNYRKRTQRERAEDADRAAARVIEKLLPVLDGFDRALAAHQDPAWAEYRRGVEMIQQQMLEALGRFKLERIPAAGEMFDPHVHQGVERVETDEQPEGTVLAELAAGYRLGDRVLRPAMVRVAAAPAGNSAGAASKRGSGVN
jgi:molecular chaperone GrpE